MSPELQKSWGLGVGPSHLGRGGSLAGRVVLAGLSPQAGWEEPAHRQPPPSCFCVL